MRAQTTRRSNVATRRPASPVPVDVVLDGLPGCACYTLDADGVVTSWTAAAERVFGYTARAIVGRPASDLRPAEHATDGRTEALLADAARTGRVLDHGRRRRADGEDLVVSETVTMLGADNRAPAGFAVVTQDLTVQLAVAEQWRTAHARSTALLEHWRGAALVVDAAGLLTYATPALARLVGAASEALLGRSLVTMVRAGDDARLTAVLVALTEAGQQTSVEARLTGDDGTWCDVRLELVNRCDDPYIDGVVVNAYPVADLDDARPHLRWEAEHDPLTGLANRAHLLARLRTPDRDDGDLTHAALLVLDLDNFKNVNDGMGGNAGDHLLMELAARLDGVVRAGDLVARLGGDEFGILAAAPLAPGEAEALAERVRAAIAEPVLLAGGPVTVTASVGVALGHDSHHAELFEAADTALHLAKERGRDRVEVYTPDLRARAHRRVETEQSLRQALDAGEMIVHYQPVVDLRSQRVVSAEALLRIRDAEGNAHLPTSLIAVAEETGLIVPIGLVVIADACRQMVEWRRALGDRAPASVAVNVSPRQLESRGLARAVERLLREHELEAGALCLEITEGSVISPDEVVVENVRALHEIGVPLVIDDFGTGYSGLAYITRFPVAGVKIDRAFVSRLHEDPSAEAIVRAVVAMAGSLGLYLVAEGVETAAQHAALLDLGCDHGQGWLWSKAVSGPDVVDVVLRLSPPA